MMGARNDSTFGDLVASGFAANPMSERAWQHLRRVFLHGGLDEWRQHCAALRSAGFTGPDLEKFVRGSVAVGDALGPAAALVLGPAARVLAERCGAGTAAELAGLVPSLLRHLRGERDLRDWLDVMCELAAHAPEQVPGVAARADSLLAELGTDGLRVWILGGLRSTGNAPEARTAFFTLADPRSRALFGKAGAEVTFSDVERRSKAFVQAVWGVRLSVRARAGGEDRASQHRTSFDGSFVQVPATFRGVAAPAMAQAYRAALGHVAAHLAHGSPKFETGSLKPLQIALVSLIEDARVERLAMRRSPGLARLWLPFHTASAAGAQTAPVLMARLSRALADPSFEDGHPWVAKGVRLFAEAEPEWDDPQVSRRIGNLLGNDLGQMRVQFNARAYVVEPLYRDDNSGLWTFPDAPLQQAEDEVATESVRLQRQDEPDKPFDLERETSDGGPTRTARARELQPDEGIPVASYPEYDYALGRERSDWTTVLEYEPPGASTVQLDRILEDYADVLARVQTLVGAARVSRPTRLRARSEGEKLDLDAAITAMIDHRAGLSPSPRVYETQERRHRDLSVLILLDISESTKDFVRGTTRTILSVERAATVLLAEALAGLGDAFSILAFCSNGREDVRIYPVKTFSAPYGAAVKARLAGLRGGLSTRMGAALRHSGETIADHRSHRRLVLVITDGEPSDVDVSDPRYFAEDARKAVQALAHKGIDVFAIGLDGGGTNYMTRIFGRRNFAIVDRIERLPEKLPQIYLRLTA